ncbi:MAG TPA: isoprenyl transferase, partial [bacterium]|nr:isoprenyl transferase [bacterium]
MKKKTLDKKKIPTHIVLLPDGNRRWARERGLPTIQGHLAGFE